MVERVGGRMSEPAFPKRASTLEGVATALDLEEGMAFLDKQTTRKEHVPRVE